MGIKKILFLLIVILIAVSNYSNAAPVDNTKSDKNIKNEAINSINYYKNYKSIMFSDENIRQISSAILEVKNNTKTKNVEITATENSEDSAILTQSMFYLNSILYISNSYWSIWLNENKITNQTNGQNNIKVVKISPLRADFEWSFGLTRWDLINPNKIIPESMYRIKDNEVTLYFSLQPNQTFIPAENRIIEGKIKIEKAKTIVENGQQKVINKNQIPEEENIFF